MKKLAQFCLVHELFMVLFHHYVKCIVTDFALKSQTSHSNLLCCTFCRLAPVAANYVVVKMVFKDGQNSFPEFLVHPKAVQASPLQPSLTTFRIYFGAPTPFSTNLRATANR
jgi:hypothetical protein